jgi:4-hydroxyphenylpyruvate dioxygenase
VDLDALRKHHVLIDGEIGEDGVPRLFFQTFAKHHPGEIFFEVVQRSGHHGFGEGNLDVLARAREAGAGQG